MFFNFDSIDQKDNAIISTIQYLRIKKINVTSNTVKKTLSEHPNYPSILSISDSFFSWKIDNVCMEIDSEKLNQIPLPFIAHLKPKSGQFVTVVNVSDKEVAYMDLVKPNTQKVRRKEEFIAIWSGIVLVGEPTRESGEREFRRNRTKEIMAKSIVPLIIIGVLFCLIINCILKFEITEFYATTSILKFLKLAGCFLTSFLLWYEIDQSNPFVKQICALHKRSNCSAVLGSKKSNLFGLITWSEIGFCYFTSSLGLLFLNNTMSAIIFLALINALALPFTIFSIYYQWRVIKQWCILCLMVQGILIAEFILYYFVFWNQIYSHKLFASANFISLINPVLVIFIMPIFFCRITKSFIATKKTAKEYKRELNRLKFDVEIFQSLLRKQQSILCDLDRLGITLGNPNAFNTIIKVCNPYCAPCAKVHPLIEEILNEFQNVKVQIIFTAANGKTDKGSEPVKHLMALYKQNDPKLVQHALHDWYISEKKDYNTFAEKYPLNDSLELQNEKLTDMDTWCKKAGITSTPTFFINGNKLPEIYNIEDLKYFLKS
jgi:uncharacterized membrane protein